MTYGARTAYSLGIQAAKKIEEVLQLIGGACDEVDESGEKISKLCDDWYERIEELQTEIRVACQDALNGEW